MSKLTKEQVLEWKARFRRVFRDEQHEILDAICDLALQALTPATDAVRVALDSETQAWGRWVADILEAADGEVVVRTTGHKSMLKHIIRAALASPQPSTPSADGIEDALEPPKSAIARAREAGR